MHWSPNPVNAKLAKGKKIERKRPEKERLKAVIDAMSDGLVLVDMDSKITTVNPAIEKMSGYPKGELVGKDIADVVSKVIKPEDLEKAMRALGTALEGKVLSPIFFTGVLKDGREIPATFTVSFLKNAEGKPITLIITIKDITELKRAEEALRESEERYRGVFTGTHDAMWIVKVKEGGEFIYEEVNSEYSNFAGLDRKDVVGRRLMEIYERETADKISRDYEWVVENKKPLKKEQHLKFVIGEKWHLTTLAPILDENGNVERIIGCGKDITELKQAEEKIKTFSDALKNAYDGVVLTDLDGNVTYANESALKIFGYTINEIMKLKVANFDQDPKQVENIMNEIKKKEKWSGELIGVRNNKEKFPAVLSVSSVKTEEGKTLGTMGVFRDITELKKAEEEKLKAAADRQRIEELEKFAKIAVGRELKMVELKKRIKELESKLKEITGKE